MRELVFMVVVMTIAIAIVYTSFLLQSPEPAQPGGSGLLPILF